MIKVISRIALGMLVLVLAACAAKRVTYQEFLPKEKGQLRIASYNVHWINGSCENGVTKHAVRLINKIKPDILLLQETTPMWERCLKQHINGRYPYRSFRHVRNEGGLGVLSRYPIQSKKYLPAKHGWYPAWLFAVKTPKGTIYVLNLHLRPPVNHSNSIGIMGYEVITTPQVRAKEIAYFYPYAARLRPLIVAGDFNEGDKGVAVRYLQQKGLVDAIHLGKTRLHTWRWKGGILPLTGRYDRLFFTPDLKASKVQVLNEGGSDHYPLVVDFN